MKDKDFTIIDNVFDGNYLNPLNDQYRTLEEGMRPSYGLTTKIKASKIPMEYQERLSVVNNPNSEAFKRYYPDTQKNVAPIEVLREETKDIDFFTRVNNINAGAVPEMVNPDINTAELDSVRMIQQPNTEFMNPANPYNPHNPTQSPSVPQKFSNPPSKHNMFRHRANFCMECINHFNECPNCYRYYSYEKKMYLVIMIMLSIIFCIIIWFLLRDINNLKAILRNSKN